MPIKGISDKKRMPRIGKIRLGVKETNSRSGNPYPKAVDYFVCKPDESTPEWAARAFHQVYGEKPRAIDIIIPIEDRDKFFPQFYRRYGSGTGLMCRGDGEQAEAVDQANPGQYMKIDCIPELCEWAAKKHCRPVGSLQFLLPKVPGLGVWQIDTSSYHSIVNLNGAIDFIRGITGNRIAWIPLKLVIKPKQVQVTDKGKTMKKTVFVMDLTHETVKLENILEASTKTAHELLLPGGGTPVRFDPDIVPDVNLDERPDDLIPDDVIEAEGEVIEAEVETVAEDPNEATRRQELINLCQQCWEVLKVPPGKRNAELGKPEYQDIEKLAELAKNLANTADRAQKNNKGAKGPEQRAQPAQPTSQPPQQTQQQQQTLEMPPADPPQTAQESTQSNPFLDHAPTPQAPVRNATQAPPAGQRRRSVF